MERRMCHLSARSCASSLKKMCSNSTHTHKCLKLQNKSWQVPRNNMHIYVQKFPSPALQSRFNEFIQHSRVRVSNYVVFLKAYKKEAYRIWNSDETEKEHSTAYSQVLSRGINQIIYFFGAQVSSSSCAQFSFWEKQEHR